MHLLRVSSKEGCCNGLVQERAFVSRSHTAQYCGQILCFFGLNVCKTIISIYYSFATTRRLYISRHFMPYNPYFLHKRFCASPDNIKLFSRWQPQLTCNTKFYRTVSLWCFVFLCVLFTVSLMNYYIMSPLNNLTLFSFLWVIMKTKL